MLPRILLIGPITSPDWTDAVTQTLDKHRFVAVNASRSGGTMTRSDLTRVTAVIANFTDCPTVKTTDGLLKRRVAVPPVDDTIRLGWAVASGVPVAIVAPDGSPYIRSVLIHATRFTDPDAATAWVIDTFAPFREKAIDDGMDPLRLVVRDAGGDPTEL